MLALLALLLTIVAQLGQLQLPKPVGFVNDFAHVIPADAASRIDRIIQDVRSKSGGEIVVVTLSDIGSRDPGEVALQIGRQWKVGKSGGPGDRARNTGVIVLVVPKETSSDGRGHVWIETGLGAEGFITDALDELMEEVKPPMTGALSGLARELHFTVDDEDEEASEIDDIKYVSDDELDDVPLDEEDFISVDEDESDGAAGCKAKRRRWR